MTVVGNDVWFEGKDANGNVGLWETDGTAAGTNELVQGLIASNMTAYGNAVYFTGTDGGLWKTDGTPGGTIEIAGAPASSIGQFTPVSNLFTGDTLYLAGDTYNVTAPGPNSYPGGFNFDPSSFDVVNGELLFSGTVILQNETADQTPTWARLLFAWNGTSLQVLGPGLFDGGMVNGPGFKSGVTYYAAPGYDGEAGKRFQAVDNLILLSEFLILHFSISRIPLLAVCFIKPTAPRREPLTTSLLERPTVPHTSTAAVRAPSPI